MIKKLLNIYDEDLYLSIQVHAKKRKSDANAFINKAMEEKAARDGVEIIKAGNAPAPVAEITDVDFEDAPAVSDPFEDDKTF
jgi:hypothetical protein